MFHDLYFDSGPCSGSIDSRVCFPWYSMPEYTERWYTNWYYRTMKLGLISQAASPSAKQQNHFFRQLFDDRISWYRPIFVLFRLGAAWEFTIPLASCWKGPLAVELEQWNRCCGTIELTTFTMDSDAAHQRQVSTGTRHYGPTIWTARDHCKSTAWKLFRHDIRPYQAGGFVAL